MKKILLTALAALSINTLTFGATDGTLGTTSTGSLNVSLSVASLVKISGLDDISLNTSASSGQGGFSDAVGLTNFCVYANNVAGNFDITATGDSGDGSGTDYALSDGTNRVAYQVNFLNAVDNSGTASGIIMSSGTAFPTNGASNNSGALTCNSASDETSTIWVTVPGSELEGKPSGNYSGTLTVQIAAQ